MKKYYATLVIFVLSLVFVFTSASTVRAAGLPEIFPVFSSQDLDGNPVSDSIFSEKKLTMVNIWTTWCPPCVGEMPDLGNMGRSMPEGAQLVGIVLDAKGPDDSGTINTAKRILSQARADFLQILPARGMVPVLSWVEAIPTTIFVDSKGKIVGTPLVGARNEKSYRAEVEKLLKTMQ